MRRMIWTRLLSMLLVVCMLSTAAFAAPGGSKNSKGDKQNSNRGWPSSGTTTPVESETEDSSVMTLVEDATTVENGDMLRASTYVLSSSASDANAGIMTLAADGAAAQAETGTVLKYFPVTLYDYDADTINAATHQLEVNNGLSDEWEGLYFSGGAPAAETYTYSTSAAAHDNLTWAQVISGTYYTDENCTTKVTVSTVTSGSSVTYEEVVDVTVDDLINYWSSNWAKTDYYCKYGDNYYPLYAKRSGKDTYTYTWGCYIDGGSSATQIGTQSSVNKDNADTTEPNIAVYKMTTTENVTGYTMTAGGSTIASLSGTDTTQTVGVRLYTSAGTQTTAYLPYAAWNWWNKNTDSNANGDLLYTGLVQSALDANKNIVFTVPDAGIFNDDNTVKDIYTNVELPFYLDTDGYYTFNSDVYGSYFHADETQGSSGTAASNTRLYFNQESPQSNSGNYGDGSKTVWAPFNDSTSFTESTMNYHFGMSATVPFTMTSDGHVQEGNEDSDDIQFTFSGDDDVWVFIDGKLVIDLGGIHNRISATINFAENTVTYFEDNSADDNSATDSYNDDSFETTQTLFTTDAEPGLISQDRATFAATDNHELTVYILERGKGSSNAQVKFNLPVKDVVSVQKIIDGVANYVDGSITTTTGLSSLTSEQIAVLNNQDFTFTLYKNKVPVAGETYLLLNANGQVVATPSTDASGQFVLKNGQTAKFTGTISTEGDAFYVEEDIKNGFIYTEFDYTSAVAGTTSVSGKNGVYSYGEQSDAYYITNTDFNDGILESQTVTVAGGEEAEDSLAFVCKNYMNASLPKPTAITFDEKIVIDFGLAVDIDIASNDYHLGDTYEYSFGNSVSDGVYTANYGTFTYSDGKITYTPNKQLTDVEVIEYTMTAAATASDGATVTSSGTAKVYIIPATTMYYEEDFTDLVTYTGAWTTVGTAQTDKQEPGVVGTVGDSPYGSDAAYRNDSGDSNGSSKYVDTTDAAAQFSYTFTGTGTSFFARTSSNSGYMRVVVTSEDNSVVYTAFRNTKYNDTDSTVKGPLYNIPVFTWDANDDGGSGYGTYTVTVTIAKGGIYGSDFWLDGIRVVNPLDEGNDVATSAYATDGEANMTFVTLRDKLIGEASVDEDDNLVWNGDGFVLFTDTKGEVKTAEEYESIGPKEEVYVYSGQSVTFSLTDWDPNTNKVYLGIKAPTGSGTVTIGTTGLTIKNAADCYYDITNYGTVTTDENGIKTVTFTITAGDSSLISVTNIKVTGSAVFTIIQGTDENIEGSESEG